MCIKLIYFEKSFYKQVFKKKKDSFLTDFVCSGRGATTGGGSTSSSSSSSDTVAMAGVSNTALVLCMMSQGERGRSLSDAIATWAIIDTRPIIASCRWCFLIWSGRHVSCSSSALLLWFLFNSPFVFCVARFLSSPLPSESSALVWLVMPHLPLFFFSSSVSRDARQVAKLQGRGNGEEKRCWFTMQRRRQRRTCGGTTAFLHHLLRRLKDLTKKVQKQSVTVSVLFWLRSIPTQNKTFCVFFKANKTTKISAETKFLLFLKIRQVTICFLLREDSMSLSEEML